MTQNGAPHSHHGYGGFLQPGRLALENAIYAPVNVICVLLNVTYVLANVTHASATSTANGWRSSSHHDCWHDCVIDYGVNCDCGEHDDATCSDFSNVIGC